MSRHSETSLRLAQPFNGPLKSDVETSAEAVRPPRPSKDRIGDRRRARVLASDNKDLRCLSLLLSLRRICGAALPDGQGLGSRGLVRRRGRHRAGSVLEVHSPLTSPLP
jgi:hypothetical protein